MGEPGAHQRQVFAWRRPIPLDLKRSVLDRLHAGLRVAVHADIAEKFLTGGPATSGFRGSERRRLKEPLKGLRFVLEQGECLLRGQEDALQSLTWVPCLFVLIGVPRGPCLPEGAEGDGGMPAEALAP
jgi:hypothetical protein